MQKWKELLNKAMARLIQTVGQRRTWVLPGSQQRVFWAANSGPYRRTDKVAERRAHRRAGVISARQQRKARKLVSRVIRQNESAQETP